MKKYKKVQNEEGFVLIAALLILLVLTVLGIAVNRNTNTEWRIAMNDRLHKETFYRADAVAELAQEVIEQSIACLGFFENDQDVNNEPIMVLSGAFIQDIDSNTQYRKDVVVDGNSLGFWRNYAPTGVLMPNNNQRDLVFPSVFTGLRFDPSRTNEFPHANINIGGNTRLTAGSAIQMAAGYEGLGQSLSNAGASLVYTINVQQVDPIRGSESTICVQYAHVLGSAGTCNYANN